MTYKFITLDGVGCCTSVECPFVRSCAQHRMADGHQAEFGFSPNLKEIGGKISCDDFFENVVSDESKLLPARVVFSNDERVSWGFVDLNNK